MGPTGICFQGSCLQWKAKKLGGNWKFVPFLELLV